MGVEINASFRLRDLIPALGADDGDADQVRVGHRGGTRYTVSTRTQAEQNRVVTVNGRKQVRRGESRLRPELCVPQFVVICMRVHSRVYLACFITSTRLAKAVGMPRGSLPCSRKL